MKITRRSFIKGLTVALLVPGSLLCKPTPMVPEIDPLEVSLKNMGEIGPCCMRPNRIIIQPELYDDAIKIMEVS